MKKARKLVNIASIIPPLPLPPPITPGNNYEVSVLPLGAVIRRSGGKLATVIFKNRSRVRVASFVEQIIRPKDDEDTTINIRKETDIAPEAEVYLEALTQAEVKLAPPVKRPEVAKPRRDPLADAMKRRAVLPAPRPEKVRREARIDPPDLLPTTTLEELWGLGESYLGESKVDLKKKYAHLDRGRQSMTLRNRIRGAWKKRGE